MLDSSDVETLGSQASGKRAWWKYLIWSGVSAGLLLFLIALVDKDALLEGWKRISPHYAALAVMCYIGTIVLCGVRLGYLAKLSGTKRGSLVWIRVSALHQMLFTVMPSGVGDAGFPVLASRLAGCSLFDGARMVLTYRIQDLWMLFVLAATGLLLRGADLSLHPVLLLGGLALAMGCLYWATDLTRLLGFLALALIETFARVWPSGAERLAATWLRSLAAEMSSPVPGLQRINGAWTTASAWVFTSAAAWSLFAMIDAGLEIGDVLLVVVGMNLIGAVAAFTIAGIGVGEGGMAAVLVALGFGTAESIAIALIVRPSAVLMVLASGGLVEFGYRVLRRVKALTTPTA